MTSYHWEVIEGEICTEIESGETKNGKQYHRFAVRTKKAITKCVCWGQKFKGDVNILSLGVKITAKGFYSKQMDAFQEVDNELSIQWFRLTDEKPKRSVPVGDALKLARERAESFRRDGFIEVQIGDKNSGVWAVKKETHCIKHQGQWRHIIDYLFDVLGIEYVNKRFREFTKIPEGASIEFKALYTKKEEYEKFIEGLKEEARLRDNGQGVVQVLSESNKGSEGNGESKEENEIDLDYI
jgi:hypothetical protein